MADSYLTQEEQSLRQDAIRLTRRNDTILNTLTRLEEALAENEQLKDRVVELERELEARVKQFERSLEDCPLVHQTEEEDG